MKNSTLLSLTFEDPSSIHLPNIEKSIFQTLQLDYYTVQLQVYTHTGQGNEPVIVNRISLRGVPAGTNCDVKYAELLFFADERQLFKARYDKDNKRIWAYYPISNFDRLYNLLRSNQNKMRLMYYENPEFESIEVTLYDSGVMPITP